MRTAPDVASDTAGRPARRTDARPGWTRAARMVAAPLAVAVLLAANGGSFQMDDGFLLRRASQPLSWEALRFRIASEENRIVLWVHPRPLEIEYFRPCVMLSLWLEWRLWGRDPRGYHATNVLLHAVAAWLLYRLLRRLELRSPAAPRAALAWGLGLAATTPLVWIAARTESLCAVFSFAGALAFLRWREGAGHRWLAAAVVLAAFAIGAKETGVVAPFLWMIAARAAAPPASDPRVRPIRPPVVAALLLPAAAAVALRLLVLDLPLPPPAYLEPFGSPPDMLRLALKVPLQLLCWLLSIPVSHLGPLDWLLARPLAVLAALLALGLLLRLLGRAAGGRTLGLAIAWATIGLLPAVPVVPTSLYAYQPLAGLAWLLGAAWQRSGRRGFGVWLGAWIVVGLLGTGVTVAFQRHASRAGERARERIAVEARRSSAERVLLVDAPFWTYGFAPELALDHPELTVEIWYVTFAPDLFGRRPSRLEWSGANELVIRSPGEGYFRSPVERFLAFGGTPEHATDVPGAPVAVRALEPGPHPRALSVRFHDPRARASSLILRFQDGELEAVPAPISARAHDGPPRRYRGKPRARSRPARSGARSIVARPTGRARAWGRTPG